MCVCLFVRVFCSKEESQEVGYCTHLEWVSPRASAFTQLLMLAAAFQGGVCLYHVALPKLREQHKKGFNDPKVPTASTKLGQTPALKPIMGVARWNHVYHKSFVGFVDLGPHLPPTLAVLLTGLETNLDYARLALVACRLPMYGADRSKKQGTHLQVLDTTEWTEKTAQLPRGLVSCSDVPGILYHSDSSIRLVRFQDWPDRGGIGSLSVGLTTSGTNHWGDAENDKVGVLTVYTTYHCERKKTSLGDGDATDQQQELEWSSPSRRHWLIQTLLGDCKDSMAMENINHPHSAKEEKEDEVVTRGTSSLVVCELGGLESLYELVPYRVARDPSGLYKAVWFRPMDVSSEDKEMIAMIESRDGNISKSIITQVIDGRELVFLPSQLSEDQETFIAQALVVSRNGGSIALWQRKVNPMSKKSWVPSIGMPCRPFLGVTEKKDLYVECHKLVLNRFQDQVGLLAVGWKGATGMFCIIASGLQPDKGLVWSQILPNLDKDPVLWLQETERVQMLFSLPSEQSIRGGIAVSTTKRVMILSPDLKILAQTPVSLPPSTLVPMGSFTVAYCSHDDHKIRYLSGLPGTFGTSGMIAALPAPQHSYCPYYLLAIRPDRFIYTQWHCGTRLVERGQPAHSFLLPLAVIRPALLLEPMIANAIATGKDNTEPFFRTVVEKFGRKVATMAHGEEEGIGHWGAGMTPRVFELLNYYNSIAAASWLLTGSTSFDRSANSRILPPFMPVTAKIKAAIDADTHLHVIANGDQYFSEYVKSPDNNMSATLPRPTDPSALLCREFAIEAMKEGRILDSLKLLDIAGTESTDAMLLQMALSMQRDKYVTPILEALSHQDSQVGKIGSSTTPASLAALALELRKTKAPSEDFTKRWMKQLAPSFQRGKRTGRMRPRIIGESAFSKIGEAKQIEDSLFKTETTEAKHVWNEGPSREKENLLMLDHIQDWFGRRKPAILGKEGVKSAEDRGASTLADILAATTDDGSFVGDDDRDFKNGWVEGIGEGLKDEEKLSAYYRFSEGDDEESEWQEEGFADITRFSTKAILFGCKDTVKLEESTSSVDEGESRKVKALRDIVFSEEGVGLPAGLALQAFRGGSVDIGMMHGPEHPSRQKCSIEFWFWVPEAVTNEVILVCRTFGSEANDLESVVASKKNNMLWELVMTTKGELEFRTIAGGKIKSEPKAGSDSEGPQSTCSMPRWNHVCITFKQDESSITSAAVNVLVKGISAMTGTLSFKPPEVEVDDFAGASGLDPVLEKSHLVFGLDHPAKFRLTELRVWALERNDDDVRTMMTEYLECAEIKRKFRVKIKKKTGGGLLSPPKGSLTPPIGLAPPGDFTPPVSTRKGIPPSPKDGLLPSPEARKGVLPSPEARKGLLAPPRDRKKQESKKETPPKAEDFGFGSDAFSSSFLEAKTVETPVTFDTAFGDASAFNPAPIEPMEEPEISPLWDSAIPLSKQVRSSAASALIRGPPATRHFGGNRGGLPDYREMERFGVGAVSICGSEKTIVWRDDQVPPGLTYPIGASGAIVSDVMDEDGSQFLCSFLAKEKRMVVFELSTRTVVVELQMTTKLNYWRFLPPEAGEDTLCFMLITPVGGFHWMPLDESPRPRQVWRRGPELQVCLLRLWTPIWCETDNGSLFIIFSKHLFGRARRLLATRKVVLTV